jgi:hypothetical protein
LVVILTREELTVEQRILSESPSEPVGPPEARRLSVERYASVLAHVRHYPPSATEEVLERLDVAPDAWEAAGQEWQTAMVEEAGREESTIATKFGAAFAAARKRLREERPALATLGRLRARAEPPAAPPPALVAQIAGGAAPSASPPLAVESYSAPPAPLPKATATPSPWAARARHASHADLRDRPGGRPPYEPSAPLRAADGRPNRGPDAEDQGPPVFAEPKGETPAAAEDPGDMTWEVPPGATGKPTLPFSPAASLTPSPFAVASRRPAKLPRTTALPAIIEPAKGSPGPDIDATAEMRRIPPEEEVLPFSAPSPPPDERRLARFDTQTGLPLPVPVWVDVSPPGERRPR